MKIQFKLLLFICVVILTSTCKKDSGATHAEGYLIDAISKKHIVGSIYLTNSTSKSGFGTIIATYKTDGGGHFSFDFTANGEGYALYGDASPLYLSSYGNGNAVSINSGQSNNSTVSLSPYGWVKLHVKNTSPHDSTDILLISDDYTPAGDHYFLGKNIDSTVLDQWGIICIPSCYSVLTYSVSKNHVTTSYSITANTNPLDTVVTTINY